MADLTIDQANGQKGNAMLVTRNVMMKYMAPVGDDTGGGGGGGGGDDDAAKKAAEEAAAKKAADEKTAADAEAAKKAAAGTEDDKSKLSDADAKLLKEVMDKKAKLKEAADELAALKAKFDGIDPEAVRKLLAEKKTAEEQELERKGDYERLKQRMAEEHGKEVKSLKEQIAELQGKLGKASGTINDLSIGSLFSQSEFIKSEMTMTPTKARMIYADHFDLEDGKVVGYDKPKGAAGRTPLVDQYGAAVPFDVAMRKIVEADPEKDHLLRSKAKVGAGSDSKKATSIDTKGEGADSVSKIASGLGGLKIFA